WRQHWPSLVSFYGFPVGLRRVLYTTNAVEAVHRSFRRALKTRGALPNEMAALKLCYAMAERLAVKWKRVLPNWPLLLNELLVREPGRFEPFLARTQPSCHPPACPTRDVPRPPRPVRRAARPAALLHPARRARRPRHPHRADHRRVP